MAEHQHVWYAVDPRQTPDPDTPGTIRMEWDLVRCVVCGEETAQTDEPINVDVTGTDTAQATADALAQQTDTP